MSDRGLGVERIRSITERLGYRSLLAVPLLREEKIMGGLTIYRRMWHRGVLDIKAESNPRTRSKAKRTLYCHYSVLG